jgi:hypothetical protein
MAVALVDTDWRRGTPRVVRAQTICSRCRDRSDCRLCLRCSLGIPPAGPTLGQRIGIVRQQQGMTLADLASLAAIPVSTLAHAEANSLHSIQLYELDRKAFEIAYVLGVDISELMEEVRPGEDADGQPGFTGAGSL